MSKNKITVAFRLFSLGSVLLATVIAKFLQIAYMWAASDITVSNTVAYICRYGYEFFNLFAVALAISVTVYAHSYFGKKTCIQSSLISFGCLAVGKVIMYVYNVIFNELSAAQLISGALSYTVEILFDAVIILLSIIFSYTFAKKRVKSKLENPEAAYSPAKSAFAAAGAYFFLLIADLSAMNVIPFFIKYSDPTPSELKNIVSDYLYYLFSIAVTFLLILLALFLMTKVTGKLKLKQYYERKTAKE